MNVSSNIPLNLDFVFGEIASGRVYAGSTIEPGIDEDGKEVSILVFALRPGTSALSGVDAFFETFEEWIKGGLLPMPTDEEMEQMEDRVTPH